MNSFDMCSFSFVTIRFLKSGRNTFQFLQIFSLVSKKMNVNLVREQWWTPLVVVTEVAGRDWNDHQITSRIILC